jgi:hypothetical protein
MSCSVRYILSLSFLALSPALAAQTPRLPRGIYAVVDTEVLITEQQQANPSITTAQLDVYFNGLYQDLLSNPAVSGLTLQVHWDWLNPNPPGAANSYAWNIVDDAFAQAAAWDAQHPAQAPKTIQIIATPGFNSPAWVLAAIPSCDGLFESPVQAPPSNCGTAIFKGYTENNDGNVFPLPWNPYYKSAWQTFLTAFAARYGSNPAFVSIAVAGPTAASAEIILPSDDDATNPQTQFSGGPISPNDMWLALLAFQYPGMAAYQGTDQAFIDAWDAAIDMYGEVFGGVTLVVTLDDKMPTFNTNTYTIPTLFSGDCSVQKATCATVTSILSYFVEPTVGGPNAKATQTSSFIASKPDIDLGINSVKMLAQRTAQLPAPSAQILAGIQVDKSFANPATPDSVVTVGCTAALPPDATDTPAGCTLPPTCTDESCTPVACIPQACLAPGVKTSALASYVTFPNVPTTDLLSPEQALYNLLNIYFGGSPAASSFGGTPGTTPLNYLQIFSQDFQYAEANVNAPAPVTETSGATVSMTAQAQFNLASQKLLEIGEPPEFFIGEASLGSGVYYLQFPDGNVFGYYNFPSFPVLYHYDLGFESFVDALDGNSGAYLYDFTSSHWWYSSPSLFPYLYDFTLNAWLYYFPNTKSPGHYTTNPRVFSNLTTGKIITM